MRHIRRRAGSPRGCSFLLVAGHEIPLFAAGTGAELLLSLLALVVMVALTLVLATALTFAVYAVCGIELLRLAPRLSLARTPVR